MTLVLGIDPDTKATGIALADEERIWGVAVAGVAKTRGGRTIPIAERVVQMVWSLQWAIPQFIAKCPLPIGMTVPQLVVVEGQDLYLQSKAAPHGMLGLAQVAGAALATSILASTKRAVIPEPKEWKGDVPKAIHQARVLKHYGVPYQKKKDYALPDFSAKGAPFGTDQIKPGEWKHVVDAIGLARWGATDRELQTRRF